MITDAFLRLSDAQALTTTAVSTNTIDLGVARDVGAGEEIYVYFTVPSRPGLVKPSRLLQSQQCVSLGYV